MSEERRTIYREDLDEVLADSICGVEGCDCDPTVVQVRCRACGATPRAVYRKGSLHLDCTCGEWGPVLVFPLEHRPEVPHGL